MEEKHTITKRVSESRTQQVHIVMPAQANGAQRLFGGQLMEWIDVVAGVVARRHANLPVTTASVDNLQFKLPANLNDTVVLDGRITYVGRTSMEVRVDTFIEALDGTRALCNVAYLVLVAIGPDGRPAEVPGVIPETEEERREWEAGKARSVLRKQRRSEQ